MFWTRSRELSPRATFGNHADLFNRFFSGTGFSSAASYPPFNIWADENGAVVTSELPGVKLEDLDITVSGKDVAVKGSRGEEGCGEGEKRVRRERPAGAFERKFQVGFQVDAGRVEARLANGVLEIRLPRAESDKPHKITVSAG